MGKKRRYITGLDGIRAIAVIMVLAYHLKLALFKSGFLGVTVFFVLYSISRGGAVWKLVGLITRRS